ncbi:MAG TPA: hypothetical protein VGF44_06795, partial [Terriglobales bacterium]
MALLFSVSGFAQGAPAQNSLQEIQMALRGQDFARVLQLLEPALKQSPRDPRLWLFQGLAYEGSQKNHEALASLNKALAMNPDYLPALEA